jgi:hypothetical protein
MDVAGQNWEGATVEDEVAAASRRIPVTKISLNKPQVCQVQSINSLRGMHSTVY